MTLELNIQDNFENSAEILGIISMQTRLKILQLINDGKEYTAKEIASRLNVSISNISQQVQKLVDGGIVLRIKLKDGTRSKIIKPIFKELRILL